MRRLFSHPTKLFVGRVVQPSATAYGQDLLRKLWGGFRGRRRKIIMMEVCQVVSEWNKLQPADEDKQLVQQIMLQSTTASRRVDQQLTLWKRQSNYDLTEGGGMEEAIHRDDLTVDGKGQIWPAHELFYGVDSDLGTEIVEASCAGYGFLVEMDPMEAYGWLKRVGA